MHAAKSRPAPSLTASSLVETRVFPKTRDGWRLHLTRTHHPMRLDRSRRPLLVVPGYGMNGFIFAYHPRGTSLVRHFAEAGHEVWVANLRGQGKSRATTRRSPGASLRRYAELDLPCAIEAVRAGSAVAANKVDVIGASLGGSIAYAHLALDEASHIGSLVTVGSPLQWRDVHPLVRVAFRSSRIASLVRVKNTRRFAELGLPIASRLPSALSPYLNHRHVDLGDAANMIKTVEDPHPRVNSDIAKWIRAGDMRLRGVNVSEALRRRREPLLVVNGNRDGVVPLATAMSVTEHWGGDIETVMVGDARRWYAHADLFVGNRAPGEVFEPIVRWLASQAD